MNNLKTYYLINKNYRIKYQKNYYILNKEKIKKYNHDYYIKNKDELSKKHREYSKIYNLKNKGRRKKERDFKKYIIKEQPKKENTLKIKKKIIVYFD